MPTAGNLLDYGIAVNFFGNYAQEGNAINGMTDKLTSSLNMLQNLVIGGGITAGLYKMSSAILFTAKSMEQNFANLKSTLGSTAKALSTLDWARIKGATTPFEIEEVNQAVGTMTTMGFNKNDKMREEVFNSVGDFAALRGFNFGDMMQRVAKASFGNWEGLGDQFGVRKQTIGTMARERMNRTPEKFEGETQAIEKAILMVEKGTQGTEEYKMAIVKLMGVLGRGGMENRLQTISGALGNVNDITANFMMNLVGYSQLQGSLASTIKDTIVSKILNPFSEAHEVIVNGVKQQTTSVEQLGNIGKGVGDLLIQIWSGVDGAIGNATSSITGWIDKLDAFFQDYQNNVAPLMLFLYLVKLQVMDFFSAFWSAFKPTFSLFITLGVGVYKVLGSIASAFGIGSSQAQTFGSILGTVFGLLLGIKAFKILTSPLKPLADGATWAWQQLARVYAGQRAVLLADGELAGLTGMQKFAKTISYMLLPLQGVATASWAFTASLLANPITWIVVAVGALVAGLAYLIYNWEEVGRSMQDVGDGALVLLSLFLPFLGIPLLLAKHWEDFSSIFANIWRGISSYVEGWWLRIKRTVIDPWSRSMSLIWQIATQGLSKFFNAVGEKFPAIKNMFLGIQLIWETIKGTITWIWTKLTDSNFMKGILSVVDSIANAFGDGGEKFLAEEKKKTAEDKAKYGGTKEEYYVKPVQKTEIKQTIEEKKEVVHNYSGATFQLNGVGDPNGFFDQMKNLSDRKGN